MPTQLTYKLNSGAEIPAIGLGTWRSAPHEVEEVMPQVALHNKSNTLP